MNFHNMLSDSSSKKTLGLQCDKPLSRVIGLLLLFIGLLFFPSCVSASTEKTEKRVVSIEFHNKSLEQALELIAKQQNISISLVGSVPEVIRSISFSDLSLEKAIERLAQLFGLDNHAAIYNLENQEILLTIFEAYPSTENLKKIDFIRQPNVISTGILSNEQITRLKYQVAANSDEKKNPDEKQILSFDQKSALQKESDLLEEGEQHKLLTTEQIRALQADELEVLPTKDTEKMLTMSQIESLRHNDVKPLELEKKQRSSLLTQEQINQINSKMSNE